MSNRIATFRTMLEKDDGNVLAHFGLANELMKEEQYDEAAAHYRRYLDSYDDEGNGWTRYADALERTGRHEEARDALGRALDAARRFGHPGLAEEIEEKLSGAP
jgi:tetratricopeptide (TPR) repeat protein